MKFLSPEVALYLYKSVIRSCMEYCCHVWAGTPSCYWELLDKLQRRIYRTVSPSLAASLEPLAYRRNVTSLSLFYRYYFGKMFIWTGWTGSTSLFPKENGILIQRCFSVTICRCFKGVYVNNFFPRTTGLWNSVSVECFSLTYDLSDFNLGLKDTF